MTKLILIRHGETIWNKEARYQGNQDITLSELGRRQAALVAKRLEKMKIDAIYTSELRRAYETAQIIASPHHLPVIKKANFNEINFGIWEGMRYQDVREQYGELYEKFMDDPSQVTAPKAESLIGVQRRVMEGIGLIVQEHSEQTVAIVAHGGIIRVIICSLLGLTFKYFWQFRQDNASLNILEYNGKKPIIYTLNDTSHLAG